MDRVASLLLICAIAAPPLVLGACKEGEPKVQVVFESDEEEEEPSGPSEASLREQYEARQEARRNQPEPDVNPDDPREKFELVWRMGKDRLRSIYSERAEMLAMLKRIDLEDPEEQEMVEPWIQPLTEFGIGRKPETMEAAPEELCTLITEVRVPAERLITEGRGELEKLEEKTAELEEKQESGGTVYQDQWDAIEEARARWSAPVKAGKQMLLVVKSLLDEAYVLADLGPRHVQRALRDCLTPIREEPLEMNMAQEQLDKVVDRSRWYRDLK